MTTTPHALPDAGQVVRVGPELAQTYLARNVHNRPLRQRHVALYAADMTAGNWRYTGEPIKFDRDGHLIDGQHRLAAIVAAGVTLPLLVVRGLDPDAQHVMDTNIKRTVSDALALDGHKSTTALASTARLLILWDSGRVAATGQSAMVTSAQSVAYVNANPDIHRAVDMAVSLRKKIDLPVSVMGAAWLRFARIDVEATHQFFDDLANHRTTGEGDPRRALLHRLNAILRDRERVPRQAFLSMLVRTWNATRDGRELQRIQWTSRAGLIEVPDPR